MSALARVLVPLSVAHEESTLRMPQSRPSLQNEFSSLVRYPLNFLQLRNVDAFSGFGHFPTAFCEGCFTGMRTLSLSFSQAISATCFLSRLP